MERNTFIKELSEARAAIANATYKELTPKRLQFDINTRSAFWNDLNDTQRYSHLLYMIDTAKVMYDAGRAEKSMKWLGFIQGALWVNGLATVTDFRRPDRSQA